MSVTIGERPRAIGPRMLPEAGFLARLHADAVLLFTTGLLLGIARIPSRLVAMPNRVESLVFDVTMWLPFLAAFVVFAPRKAPTDGLWKLGAAVSASFVFSTLLAIVTGQLEDKLLTTVAGAIALVVFIFGSWRMAEPLVKTDAMPLIRGMQLGFCVLTAFLVGSGSLDTVQVGEVLGQLGFVHVEGINRNTVTFLALAAVAGSMASVSVRERPPWLMLALDALTVAMAGYLLYRVTGKGAWLSAAVLLAAFLGVMVWTRRWGLLAGTVVAGLAAVPIMYERIVTYLLIYSNDQASSTFSGRTWLWQAAWETVSEQGAFLFGFGFDSAYGTAFLVNGMGLSHFHNEFINALFCGGVIGLALLLAWVIWYMIQASTHALRTAGTREGRLYVFGLYVGLLTLSRFMSDVTLTTFMEALPLWFLCAAMVGLAAERAPRAAEATRAPVRGAQQLRRAPPRGHAPAGVGQRDR